MMETQCYLRCYQPQSVPRHTLICFPHAGGAASAYRFWPALLSPDVEVINVQYPGREDRFSEPLVDDMSTTVNNISREIHTKIIGRPFSLFGHSMGGAIAHEVAQQLTRLHQHPMHLIISGRQPPRFHPLDSDIHTRSDNEVIDELLRLSQDNSELLNHPELAAIILPVIRNDYKLIETYRPSEPLLLSCPITVFVGEDDSEMTRKQADAWRGYSTNATKVHVFLGGHFFIVSERAKVIRVLRETLLNNITKGDVEHE